MAVTWDGAGRTRGAAAGAWAWRDAWAPPLAAVSLTILCGLLSLQGAYNHDEEQYVAAAVLARSMRPILDFPYLQSPLQPWLFAPLFDPAHGHVFAIARLVSAALTLAVLGCGYAIVRRAGGSPALAALATVAVAASGVARTLTLTGRNDALPCALMAAGAGLLLSLSLSAKLTYLFAPAAGGLWMLAALARRRAGWGEVLAFAGGLWMLAALVRRRAGWGEVVAFSLAAAAGLVPIVATLAADPAAAWFDMVGFHRDATPAWYVRNGIADRRGFLFHLAFWIAVPLRDPTVIAATLGLLAMGAAVATGRAKPTPQAVRVTALLLLFAALAVVTASVPNPSFTAYAAPPAVLVVLAAAAALAGLGKGGLKVGLTGLLAAAALLGGAPAAARALGGLSDRATWTSARIQATAQAVRDALAAARLTGPVATLNPVRVLDAGLETYPELAPGPFLFRAADDVSVATVRHAGGATPATMDALFARRPPAAILTGYEGGDDFRIVADAPLAAWARAHGYREMRLPDGGALHLAPGGVTPRPPLQ